MNGLEPLPRGPAGENSRERLFDLFIPPVPEYNRAASAPRAALGPRELPLAILRGTAALIPSPKAQFGCLFGCGRLNANARISPNGIHQMKSLMIPLQKNAIGTFF